MNNKDEIKTAVRSYRRMRAFRSFLLPLFIVAGFGFPWVYGFNQTDTLICGVGAMVLWGMGHTELRLKTMQIRLAGMADQLDRLNGNEPEDNFLLELSDW